MSDQSNRTETAVGLVCRAAMMHLAHADELLSTSPRWSAESIHEIRKSVKRIRAAFDLLRTRLEGRRDDWDRRLQSVNRTLSATRDLDASIARLTEFTPLASAEELAVIERLRLELAHRRVAVEREHASAAMRPLLMETLRAVRDGMEHWNGAASGTLLDGPEVTRMVKKARRRIEHLSDDPHSEDVHALRKVVKQRLYWLEILRPIWPNGMKSEERLVDRLAEKLGRHHDLVVLQAHLASSSLAQEDVLRAGIRSLSKRLRKAQRELERQSLKQARRLFAERPKAFRRRWAAWEDIWRETDPKGREIPSTPARSPRPR
jgi:CHAD domain-containing protein